MQKSTILEALDIFFNDGKGAIKIDSRDVNVQEKYTGNEETEISVVFTELPEEILIDSTAPTSLQAEYMLNRDKKLEITKKFKNGTSQRVFIRALHPSNPECCNLLLQKNADLKKTIKEKGIECETKTTNAVMRQAIWGNYKDDLCLAEIEIDVSKEDAKKIWEKLVDFLPVYSLFQSDRKNSDGDSEVQDPLKEAVKQIFTEAQLQEDLERIANEVENKLKEVSNKTLEKLREIDSAIAESLNPIIPTTKELKWQDVFKNVSITGDEGIPINKRGSGVKRLILLSFFRAEAEKQLQRKGGVGVIYAIEEPETSQHSENQRILIDAFKSLAKSGKSQVILTTHSSNIVKQLDFSSLRLIKTDDEGGKVITSVSPSMLLYPSLNEVNYLAFGEATEGYHNELYSLIKEQKWLEEYQQGKPKKLYIKFVKKEEHPKEIILSEYVRHQIHHPENHKNVRFTRDELKESIEMMRTFIKAKHDTKDIVEPD